MLNGPAPLALVAPIRPVIALLLTTALDRLNCKGSPSGDRQPVNCSGSPQGTRPVWDSPSRAGVCRDFAHLGIALCRALGIPARFVSGYAYGLNPPDFHAYFEAFLGGRWILADPTRRSPQSSFVRIGQGRDAADTSFATIFGNAALTEMQLSNQLVTTGSQPPQYAEGPISSCPV